jgi:MFS family permease
MADEAKPRDGALRNPEFLKFWTGETVSLIGSEVTRFAFPLVAILSLGSSVFEVGVLNAMRYVPIVIVSLFAGVWLDRRRRRPILIATNLGRAVLIGMIPLASTLHLLSIQVMYAVALLVGTLTVIFDVGSLSYVPNLVERKQLADANGRLQTSFSLALIAGPSLAGLLIGLLTAPVTLTVDAVSFLFSVVMISLIRKPEQAPESSGDRPTVRSSIAEGLRAVFGRSVLRNLLTQSATFNMFQNAMMTVFVVYVVRVLGLSPAQLGFVLGAGALGALLGSVFANRITRTVGLGRTLFITTVAACLSPLVFLLAPGHDTLSMAILIASHTVYGLNLVIYNVNTLTLRQVVTPNRLLARMNASYRMVLFGTIPLGALLGGTLGRYFGLRTAMVATAVLLLSPIAWTLFSPVFRLRAMPTGPIEEEPGADTVAAKPATPIATGEPAPAPAPDTAEGDDIDPIRPVVQRA